jgi:hypothetical protein
VVHLDWLWYTVWYGKRACEGTLKLKGTPAGDPAPSQIPEIVEDATGGSGRDNAGGDEPLGGEEEHEKADEDDEDDEDDDLLNELESAVPRA